MDFIFWNGKVISPLCISVWSAGSIRMISMLECWKQLQAIDSVCLTLGLLPVGKASGIPTGVILKGAVCLCAQVYIFMQPRVYYNQHLSLFHCLYTARLSAGFFVFWKMPCYHNLSLMRLFGEAWVINTPQIARYISACLFLSKLLHCNSAPSKQWVKSS